jgi:hypothetical protein
LPTKHLRHRSSPFWTVHSNQSSVCKLFSFFLSTSSPFPQVFVLMHTNSFHFLSSSPWKNVSRLAESLLLLCACNSRFFIIIPREPESNSTNSKVTCGHGRFEIYLLIDGAAHSAGSSSLFSSFLDREHKNLSLLGNR